MRCISKILNDKKYIRCPNKPYGKLKYSHDNMWCIYCKDCYKFQLKENPELWIDKRVLKKVKE